MVNLLSKFPGQSSDAIRILLIFLRQPSTTHIARSLAARQQLRFSRQSRLALLAHSNFPLAHFPPPSMWAGRISARSARDNRWICDSTFSSRFLSRSIVDDKRRVRRAALVHLRQNASYKRPFNRKFRANRIRKFLSDSFAIRTVVVVPSLAPCPAYRCVGRDTSSEAISDSYIYTHGQAAAEAEAADSKMIFYTAIKFIVGAQSRCCRQ
jgi:hypothetical protein